MRNLFEFGIWNLIESGIQTVPKVIEFNPSAPAGHLP